MIKRGIGIGIVFLLALLAIAAVSATAGIYSAPVPRGDMTIHYHNAGASGANGVPLYTVKPVTSPYIYRGNAQVTRMVNPGFNTKRMNYTRWKPNVYPDNRWRISKRFASRTIDPYNPRKPVIASDESDLSVLEKPEWEIGDWWIVKVSQLAFHWAVPNPPWVNILWKCEVVDIANVDGKECFVVKVVEYPDGKSTYGVYYFEKENLALYQVHESGEFTRKFNSDSAAPVIADYTTAPFLYEFPAFPLECNVTHTYQIYATLEKRNTGKMNIQQSVSVDTFTTKDGKTSKCLKVSLQGADHNVIQFWQPDVPWCIYEEKDGVVKAWLVDWGHEEVKKKLQ